MFILVHCLIEFQADPPYIKKCSHVRHRTRRMFCAMMAQLDDAIFNVTSALQSAGMWEDTLLVFTSDNGGNGMAGGFNYPFTGAKLSGWEAIYFFLPSFVIT